MAKKTKQNSIMTEIKNSILGGIENLDDKSIIHSGRANHFIKGEAVGGKLYLQTDKLQFQSHRFNIQNHGLMIEIEQIKEVSFYNTLGFVPNGLAITTLGGQKEKFVVSDRRLWKEEIEKLKPPMLTIPEQTHRPVEIDRNPIPAYIAIVSALFAIIGCFMPWAQFGFLQVRGIEGDGIILLIAAAIAAIIAISNLSKRKNRNAWIFLIAGLIGCAILYMDISALKERGGNGITVTIFGGGNVANFIGTGVYIALLGSIGLVLAGLVGFFKRNVEEVQVHTAKDKE
jgi:hypothetical protein